MLRFVGGGVMEALEEMARHCFGYGRWEAPYWFVGLEEGMSGTLDARIAAFQEHGRQTGLTDCKGFHEKIGDPQHHKDGAKPQKTWRALILMLLTYRNLANDDHKILEYQQTAWGMSDGETLLTELFGLPAKDLAAGAEQRGLHFTEALQEEIRHQRLATIKQKQRLLKPRLLIMYGLTRKIWFERLAGKSLEKWDIIVQADTVMTLIPHPADYRRPIPDQKWIEHAQKLRLMSAPSLF